MTLALWVKCARCGHPLRDHGETPTTECREASCDCPAFAPPESDAHELGETEGHGCRCQVVNDDGRMHLPPENMRDDCPLHGTAARERLEAVAADRGPFKFMYLGGRFYPLDPRPSDIHLEDIAHGLALTCRFGGACRSFYSVAEHSARVSEQMEEHYRPPGVPAASADDCSSRTWGPWSMTEGQIVDCMHGLLHDASEAYLGDVVSPIKMLPGMRDFRLAETIVQLCVTSKFGLPDAPSKLLELVDARMLLTEARDLLKGDFPPANIEPYEEVISPMGPMVAESAFLDRFHGLEDALRHRLKPAEPDVEGVLP